MNTFAEAMEKAGLTDEFLLSKTEELIDAIKSGVFKPRNKKRELEKLESARNELLYRIVTKKKYGKRNNT